MPGVAGNVLILPERIFLTRISSFAAGRDSRTTETHPGIHLFPPGDSARPEYAQVSFTIENKRLPNYTDWMKHRVDSPQSNEINSHRMSVVKPVFGNIGTNERFNRFSLRGKKKVNGQWRLYCLVHNNEKFANYGRLAA